MTASPITETLQLRLAHSPDSDDAFMFYGLATNKVRVPGYKFSHTLTDIETLNQRALKDASMSIEDVALVVPHQANQRIIQAACERLGVEEGRAVSVIDRYGNTSSASIPLAFDDARKNDRVHKGDYALLTGFGAGMTWASAVVRWSK